jgi:hypothetical protein
MVLVEYEVRVCESMKIVSLENCVDTCVRAMISSPGYVVGTNTPAVATAPLVVSTDEPPTVGVTLDSTTSAPVSNTTHIGTTPDLAATAIASTALDPNAQNPDMSGTTPPSELSPTDESTTTNKAYLELYLRDPCAKQYPELADAGTRYFPLACIYNHSTGLTSHFHRTIRAMITEILHGPDIKFSHIAVDTFVDDLPSNDF